MPEAPNNPPEEDDDEEGEEGSEVEGIDPQPAPAPTPDKETRTDELLHRMVMELVEIKTSLAVLHHKLDRSLSGRLLRWLSDRG